MRALPVALLAVAVSGCYTYKPVATTEPAPGTQLRVELTLSGGDTLARFLGPSVQMVDGRLLQMTPSAIELGVTQVTMYSGIEQYWKGETVTLPKPYVAKVEERTFSWGKTGLLAGVVVASLAALQSAGGISGLFGGHNPPSNQQ
jgi:hypothetical protein